MRTSRLVVGALFIMAGCGSPPKPAPVPTASPNIVSAREEHGTAAYSQHYCLDGQFVDSVPGLREEPLGLDLVPSLAGKVAMFTRESPSAKTDAILTGVCAVGDKVRSCRYASAAKGSIDGFVELRVVVDEKGAVKTAERTTRSTSDAEFAECARDAVAKAKFTDAVSGEFNLLVVPRVREKDHVVAIVESGTDIAGRLPPERVKGPLRAAFPKFRACFETLVKGRAFAEEMATLRFIISESGKVTDLEVAADDATFRGCLTTIANGLTFPEPEVGKVRVIYPVRFVLDI